MSGIVLPKPTDNDERLAARVPDRMASDKVWLVQWDHKGSVQQTNIIEREMIERGVRRIRYFAAIGVIDPMPHQKLFELEPAPGADDPLVDVATKLRPRLDDLIHQTQAEAHRRRIAPPTPQEKAEMERNHIH